VDVVLDKARALGLAVRGWSAATWGLVDRSADRDLSVRGEVRAIAWCCADSAGRQALAAYAERTVLAQVPDSVSAGARGSVSDAVLAALVADLLPVIGYAVLTRPVNAAAEGPGDRPDRRGSAQSGPG
jgi:hypothetical protein